jgi:hypothetical protein
MELTMTKSTSISLSLAAVLGMLAACSSAPTQATLPCRSVTFHQDFLRAYPNAPAACRGVVEKNGAKRVHFVATVVDASGGKVTLNFLNARNDVLANTQPLVFTPRPDINLSVNGQPKAVKDLKRGDQLDFWVPEGRLGIITDPSGDALTDLSL